jgi:hypothetical protein
MEILGPSLFETLSLAQIDQFIDSVFTIKGQTTDFSA